MKPRSCILGIIEANVLQISEGTNSVALCGWIWAFVYVLLWEVRN
jgi:hypothetical protein